MTRPGPIRRLVGALVLGALLLATTVTAGRAAPNPFGDRSTATTIVLHRDGSYDVILRQTVELRLAYDISFGGSLHDGFRLPDDGGRLPPYLRAAYALTSFTLAPGQPVPADFTRTHHLVSVHSLGSYQPGLHAAEVRYRVTGAARPTARGWAAHVRLLDVGYGQGDQVTVDASEVAPTRLALHCVTFSPDSRTCGSTDRSTLTQVFGGAGESLPPEYRIEVTADNSAVPAPGIDR